jgi:hypothetical protein
VQLVLEHGRHGIRWLVSIEYAPTLLAETTVAIARVAKLECAISDCIVEKKKILFFVLGVCYLSRLVLL